MGGDAVGAVALRGLPKVELHVHLGGAISEATATLLARRHGVDPGRMLPLTEGRYPARYGSFEGFLRAYMAVNDLVRTPDDLELVAAAFARQQADLGVVHTEAIFTAMIYVRNGMDPREMWAALRSGLSEGAPGTTTGVIVDTIRDLGPEEAEATIRLVEEADAPIVGLGLTGVEGAAEVGEFQVLRRAADRLGLGFEVHAGEMGPPESVRAALDELGPDRIGHGVAAARDPALIERLRLDGVPLEVCPTSNVAVGLFVSLEDHPFPRLWRAGVNVTVNSDDPPFFRTTLVDELEHAVRLAGLTAADVAELQRRAARAAFAAPAVRRDLVAAVDAWEAARQLPEPKA